MIVGDEMLFIELHLLNCVARTAKPRYQPLQLFCIARFAFDVGYQALGRQCRENALVIDLDNIDIMFVEQPHDLEQCARPILQC